METEFVHRHFATTVGLITSHHLGKSNVMACEWTMSVGWKPLRVMAVVHHDQLTHEYVSASGQFGVSLCSDALAAQSNLAGSVSGRERDKLADPLFCDLLLPARHIRAPLIAGAVLHAECEVVQTVELEGYTGFVGRALYAQADPEASPLFYHRRKYFHLGPQVAKR